MAVIFKYFPYLGSDNTQNFTFFRSGSDFVLFNYVSQSRPLYYMNKSPDANIKSGSYY